MKRLAYALCAASTLAFATPASAVPTVTVDTTTGQPLMDMIHASKSNTDNNKVQVFGSTAQGAQSQNVLFTAGNTPNVPITEATATAAGSTVGNAVNISDNGGGFAFINDSAQGGATNGFYDLIINPDQLFTDIKFAVQLTTAGTFDVYYLLSGSSTFVLATNGGDNIQQAGKTNTNFLVDLTGGTFDAVQIVSTVPLFQVEQMSINRAAAVPEPATWMMMLLGFGGIGFAMRRRNRQHSLMQIA